MASINGKTETLCIFGHPVAHSKSPAMHNALFKALGINATYLPYAPEPENFAKAIEGFKAMKFRGANVTIPYKTEFFNADGTARLVDELSEISKFTGSVNTLYWKDGIVGGTLCGTTTDPYGCIKNLEVNGIDPYHKKIALLGNGGAAKAIAFTLVEQENALTIVCRQKEKGFALANSLNNCFQALNNKNLKFQNVQVTTFNDFANISANFDIIINATSVGMNPKSDETPITQECLHKGQTVMDIVYTPRITKLLHIAKEKQCKIINGLGMLVYQGIESFKKWFPEETKNMTTNDFYTIMRKGIMYQDSLFLLQNSITKKKDNNIITFAHIQQERTIIQQKQKQIQQNLEQIQSLLQKEFTHKKNGNDINNFHTNLALESFKTNSKQANISSSKKTALDVLIDNDIKKKNNQNKSAIEILFLSHERSVKDLQTENTKELNLIKSAQKTQTTLQKNLEKIFLTLNNKKNFHKSPITLNQIKHIKTEIEQNKKQLKTIEISNTKSKGLESIINKIKKETENQINEELVAIMRKGMQG